MKFKKLMLCAAIGGMFISSPLYAEDTGSADEASADSNKINYFSVKSTEAGNKENDGASGVDSVAIGPNAKTGKGAPNSIAIGSNSKAGESAGENSIAIGFKARTVGDTSIGEQPTAGNNAIAIGANAGVLARKGIAIGADAVVTGYGREAIAIGAAAKATFDDAIAIGNSANASTKNGIAIGKGTKTGGVSAIAIGEESSSINSGGIAIGKQSESKLYAVAIGSTAQATATSAVAIGDTAQAKANNTVALGSRAEATNTSDTALGTTSKASGGWSVAIGQESKASGAISFAGGYDAQAAGYTAQAIGMSSRAGGEAANAYGREAIAAGLASNAIGLQATATGDDSIAIGRQATAVKQGVNGIAIGQLSYIGAKTELGGTPEGGVPDHSLSIVDNDTSSGKPNQEYMNSIAIGNSAKSFGYQNTVLGAGAEAYDTNDVAIGIAAKAKGNYATAIGQQANANGLEATALGHWARAYGDNAIAIGSYAITSTLDGSGEVTNGIAIGQQARAASSNSVALGKNSLAYIADDVKTEAYLSKEAFAKENGVVSVGNAEYKVGEDTVAENRRRIINVAGGADDYDAVNVAQLKQVGLKFTGDNKKDGKPVEGSVNLGTQQLAINGDANITTTVNGQAISLALSKDVIDKLGAVQYFSVKSTETGNKNNAGATGTNAIAIGPKVTASGEGSVAIGFNNSMAGAGGVVIGRNTRTSGDSTVIIGDGAGVDPNISLDGHIAIGKNARVFAGGGEQEAKLGFDPTNWPKGGAGGYDNPTDRSRVATGIAMGVNAKGRTGSIDIGGRTYNGLMGGKQVKGNDAIGFHVNQTALGTNTYAKGLFSTMLGSYSIATGSFDGSGRMNTAAYGAQNFGATVVGSLNSIRSNGSGGLFSPSYQGIANTIVGLANTADNTNGSLVFGAGNKVTNSITRIVAPTSGADSVDAMVDKLQSAIRSSDSGGATMAFGGGNVADYTQRTAIIGVNNTVTGTAQNISESNAITGFENTATNVSHVTATGSNNTIADTKNTILLGDNRTVTGSEDSIILGRANKAAANNGLRAVPETTINTTADRVVVMGYNADATVNDSVALGSHAVATVDKGVAGYDISTDKASTKTDATWVSTLGSVSVGADGKTRQITNVAAGAVDTDAVNVAQLKAARVEVVAGDNVTVDTDTTAGHTKYTVSSSDKYITGAELSGDTLTINRNDGEKFTVNNLATKTDLAADKIHYYSVKGPQTPGGNYNNDGATGDNALAAGVGASAVAHNSIAIGHKAWILDSNGGKGSGDIAIGNGAKVENYADQSAGISLGQNAYVENMAGKQEAIFALGQTTFSGNFLSTARIPADPSKLAAGIAIGENSYARSGSLMVGTHKYIGKLGDVNVDTSTEAGRRATGVGVNAVTIGTNSFNHGTFSTITGAYSIATSNYAGGRNSTDAGKNFGSTITGSLNSIESATAENSSSGVASSIVGLANKVANANGALIFGAGNEITNSVTSISIPGTGLLDSSSAANSAKELQEKMLDIIRNTDSGGSTLAIGGSNKADYTRASSIIGVKNTLTGTAEDISQYNSIMGYNNKAENVDDVTVAGINNTITGTKTAVVFGDNHKVTGAHNSVVIGSVDEETELTATDAVVIGHNANVAVAGGVALGSGAIANTDKGVAGYDILTNAASTKTDATWKSTLAAVSVGSNGNTRQITNVAAGAADTDAVNVAQLKAARVEVVAGDNVTVDTDTTAGHTKYTVKSTDTKVKSGTVTYGNNGAGTMTLTDTAGGTVNVTGLQDKYITGASLSGDTLTISRNDGAKFTVNNLATKTDLAANKIEYFSVKSEETGNKDNTGATGVNAIAIGPNARALLENSVALGNGARVTNEGGVGTAGIAIGKNAYSHAMTNGNHEAIITFGRDKNQLAGGVAIGQDTHARIGNVELGNRDYSGQIGDFDFRTSNGKIGGAAIADNGRLNNSDVTTGVGSTTVGDNSFNMANFATIQGSYNVISKAYDKPTASWAGNQITRGTNALHNAGAAIQGLGSVINGSLNSIEGNEELSANIFSLLGGGSDPVNGLMYSGTASNIIGVANRINKSNGALIFGTGNEITNSYITPDSPIIMDSLSTNVPFLGTLTLDPTIASSSVKELAETFRKYAQDNRFASVGITGSGNKADYALFSTISGVGNTLTGNGATTNEVLNSGNTKLAQATSSNVFSAFNAVSGYENTATNVSYALLNGVKNTVSNSEHIVVNGSYNELTDSDNATVIGDKRKLTDADNSIVIGSADAETELNVKNATVLGHNANVAVAGGVALGSGAIANTDKGAAGYDILTNAASTKTDATWKSTLAAVSVGSSGNTRQITNVAAGAADTDAVNVAQLKAARVEVVAGDNISVVKDTSKGYTEYKVSAVDKYITGATLNDGTLTINRNDGEQFTVSNLATKDDVAADKIHYYSVNAPKNLDNYDNDGAKQVGSIVAGPNALSKAVFSNVMGSYSRIDADSTFQGATASVYGAFNTITQNENSDMFDGVANSIIGVANKTENANGALIFGAGNQISNSAGAVTLTPEQIAKIQQAVVNNTPEDIASILAEAVKDSGGAVMAVGGANSANYAKLSQLTGVGNSLTGTAETPSSYNFITGYLNNGSNINHLTAIGSNNKVADTDNAIVLSDNRKLSGAHNAVVIGIADKETELKVEDATILGHNANVIVAGGVALGSGSIASTDKGVAGYDPLTNKPSTDTTNSTWNSTLGAVSVGSEGKTRQITNVAAGAADTDAVNVAQLKRLGEALTNNTNGKMSAFTVGAGQAAGITVNNENPRFDIVGADNIKTEVKGNTVEVGLADKVTLTDNGSIQIGNTTVDNSGITIKPSQEGGKEVSLTNTGLNNGGNKIVNVADGDISENSTDAVNGSQLHATNERVTNVENKIKDISTDVTNNISSINNEVNNVKNEVNNVKGDVNNVKNEVNNVKNEVAKGWNIEATEDGGKVINGQKANVKMGDTVNIKAGKNIEITQDGNSLKVSAAANQSFSNIQVDSIQIGGNNGPTISSNQEGNIVINNKRITNVQDGKAPNDVATVGQVSRVENKLSRNIHKVDKNARAGIAGANAAAALPQVRGNGKSMMATAVGTFRGQSAIAVGYSTASDNGKVILKLQGNMNSQGDVGAGAGVGYEW
ncbi:trimeric autotransporter adhesin [Mesocricetibacter intestinalis]|uniref:Trimeric autotransporter adhesin n=1 Tax=Mesocricetibacter intestinalis TaxID=1521930 RepID=A0A4R6VLP5_9PAST|nr:YadA-like family protein [Mesocricetibacter intestinalis]TDQ59750.1 trimeric autotransporter adhesin [Mesocricetibacter intestinalis]